MATSEPRTQRVFERSERLLGWHTMDPLTPLRYVRGSDTTRVPVPSGRAYRVDSPPHNAPVTPELAQELGRVLERFAVEAGFSPERPVGLYFKPGVVGHHQVGRAADVYAVGGVGLDRWKEQWDAAKRRASHVADPRERDAIMATERRRNLGWRLYKALQLHGQWARPPGYPIQLFGPWTRTEGPWTRISDRLLHAHRDHIHVAK